MERPLLVGCGKAHKPRVSVSQKKCFETKFLSLKFVFIRLSYILELIFENLGFLFLFYDIKTFFFFLRSVLEIVTCMWPSLCLLCDKDFPGCEEVSELSPLKSLWCCPVMRARPSSRTQLCCFFFLMEKQMIQRLTHATREVQADGFIIQGQKTDKTKHTKNE